MIIKINVRSLTENTMLIVNTSNNTCTLNDKSISINAYKFAKELGNILVGWNFNYGPTSNSLDLESFCVQIEENDKVYTYLGEGSYPENYNAFKKLLSEVMSC